MENLTLEELKCIAEWFEDLTELAEGYDGLNEVVYDKIKQAISDKELTKNDLDF